MRSPLPSTLLLVALTTAAPASAQERWRVDRGDVRVVCPLTVGGSFEARSQGLSGDLTLKTPQPASLDGTLKAPLDTLDTGISLRNDHMKNNYLEVGRGAGFDTAELGAIRLLDLDAAKPEGRLRFIGELRLHGVTRPVEGTAEIKRAGSSIRITARLPIHLPDFGIASPRYLGVGVKDDVQVNVSFEAVAVSGGAR